MVPRRPTLLALGHECHISRRDAPAQPESSWDAVLRQLAECQRSHTRMDARAHEGASAETRRLRMAMLHVVIDPSSSWFAVIAACRAFRHMVIFSDAPLDQVTATISEWILEAGARSWSRIDKRLAPLRPLLESSFRNEAFRTTASLAKHLDINERVLTAAMLREFGISPVRLRIITRVRRMVVALLTTDEHVAQIAYAQGYGHPSQADHDLRRLLGVSPRELRRMLTLP